MDEIITETEVCDLEAKRDGRGRRIAGEGKEKGGPLAAVVGHLEGALGEIGNDPIAAYQIRLQQGWPMAPVAAA